MADNTNAVRLRLHPNFLAAYMVEHEIRDIAVQSIVQTAGSVNRHRMVDITSPNIGILQFNARSLNSKAREPVFVLPGLEMQGTHPDHDMATLLAWGHGMEIEVDARLRFDKQHSFSQYDDIALNKQTEDHFARLTGAGRHGIHWMCDKTYLDTPLRGLKTLRISRCLIDEQSPRDFMVQEEFSDAAGASRSLNICTAAPTNTWLVKTDAELELELELLAAQAGVDRSSAMTVKVTGPYTFVGTGSTVGGDDL
jgi:hypothetical protein